MTLRLCRGPPTLQSALPMDCCCCSHLPCLIAHLDHPVFHPISTFHILITGKMLLEKMMSGLYMGDNARRILQTFACKVQLFGSKVRRRAAQSLCAARSPCAPTRANLLYPKPAGRFARVWRAALPRPHACAAAARCMHHDPADPPHLAGPEAQSCRFKPALLSKSPGAREAAGPQRVHHRPPEHHRERQHAPALVST